MAGFTLTYAIGNGLLICCVKSCRALGLKLADKKFNVDQMISIMLMILDLSYFAVAKSSLEIFDCKKVDRQFVLDKENTIVCYDQSGKITSEYNGLLPWAIISLIVYVVGIPLAFAVLLLVNRKRIMEDVSTIGEKAGETEVPTVRSRFGFLYKDFKPKMYFWKLIVTLRKLAVVSIIIYFSDSDPIFQAQMIVLVLLFSVLLHHFAMPYAVAPDQVNYLNQLEFFALLSTATIIAAGVLQHRTSTFGKNADNYTLKMTFLTIITCLLITVLFLFYLALIVYYGRKSYKVAREKSEKDLDTGVEMGEVSDPSPSGSPARTPSPGTPGDTGSIGSKKGKRHSVTKNYVAGIKDGAGVITDLLS